MSSIPTSRNPMGDRRGFSLIELLVALVISGILVGVVFQLLQGNSRFVRLQAAREEVQQNGRAAVDLISSELRAIPRGGIIAMADNSIAFRLPRAWGILCNALDPLSSTAAVRFPDGAFPADFQPSDAGWGIAVEEQVDPADPNPSFGAGTWNFVVNVASAGAGSTCDDNLTAGTAPLQDLAFTSGSGFVTAGTVLPGTPVLVFERMRYDVADGGTVPGWWIRRAIGGNTANMQPLAGPVSGADGLDFTYLAADGVTQTADVNAVRTVGVRVVTQSRAESERNGVRRPEQMDTVTTDVFLRN